MHAVNLKAAWEATDADSQAPPIRVSLPLEWSAIPWPDGHAPARAAGQAFRPASAPGAGACLPPPPPGLRGCRGRGVRRLANHLARGEGLPGRRTRRTPPAERPVRPGEPEASDDGLGPLGRRGLFGVRLRRRRLRHHDPGSRAGVGRPERPVNPACGASPGPDNSRRAGSHASHRPGPCPAGPSNRAAGTALRRGVGDIRRWPRPSRSHGRSASA